MLDTFEFTLPLFFILNHRFYVKKIFSSPCEFNSVSMDNT